MLVLIIINFLFILFIYVKYIKTPKSKPNDYEEIKKMDSALIGYIDDKWGNALDWTISEVLELNRKGYITIEYADNENANGYIIKKLKDNIINLKTYEANAYRILFEKSNVITMRELEEKLKYNQEIEKIVNVKSMSIRNEVEDEAINLELVNKTSEKIINALKRIYPIAVIIALFFLKETNIFIITGLLVESILTIFAFSNTNALTKNGKLIKSKINNYTNYLLENKLLQSTKIVDYILMEKDYINSIALHINSEARMELITEELVENSRQRRINQIGDIIFVVGYSIFFWFYIIMTIIF